MKPYYINVLLLCLSAFGYYFYDITSDYFKYRTVTSVNFNSMPEFSYTLVIELSKNTFNSSTGEFFSQAIYVNDKATVIGNVTQSPGQSSDRESYSVSFQNISQLDTNFIFMSKNDQTFRGGHLMMVDGSGSINIPIELSTMRYPSMMCPGYFITIVSLLEPPYDTKCIKTRNANGKVLTIEQCKNECTKTDTVCRTKCEVRSCQSFATSVQFTFTGLKQTTLVAPTIAAVGVITTSNNRMDSAPAISMALYVFYSLGLLCTFADFSIYIMSADIGKYIADKMCPIRMSYQKLYRFLLIGFISVMCGIHVHYVTIEYLEYNHETKTYIGTPISIELPQFFACSTSEKVANVSDIIQNFEFPFLRSEKK